MKYNIIAKGMWLLFKPSFKNELKLNIGIQESKITMKKAKKKYKEIILRTPAIGAKNPMVTNVLSCAMLISVYKSLNNEISLDKIGEIYEMAMKKNIVVQRLCKKRKMFTKKWQNKRSEKSLESQKKEYEFDWVSEFIYGNDVNEFGINFYECGICKLCNKEGCSELAKQMCKFDFVMAEFMGANLTRNKTIANGDGMCDFWYTKH